MPYCDAVREKGDECDCWDVVYYPFRDLQICETCLWTLNNRGKLYCRLCYENDRIVYIGDDIRDYGKQTNSDGELLGVLCADHYTEKTGQKIPQRDNTKKNQEKRRRAQQRKRMK